MTRSESADIKIPAVERTLDILEYVAGQKRSVTLKEISKKLSIPMSSAFRIVKNLCSRGYIKKDEDNDGYYNLGMQLIYLTQSYNMQSEVISASKGVMKKLAIKSGQTAQLGVLQSGGVIYVGQAQPVKPVSIIATLGTILPVNVSAAGKVLVAYLPGDERRTFLEGSVLVNQTKNSITDPGQLLEEVERVKTQGYAVDMEEYARGIGCISAPIFDHMGNCVAAVGTTGHISDYIDKGKFAILKNEVLKSAENISQKLGYRNSLY